MRAMVVYDSKWGNTELIAKAIADGIGKGTKAVKVGAVEAKSLDTIDLLVIGSPVNGGRPTKPMQAYLKGIPQAAGSKLKIATFDTRMTMKFAEKFGFAANRMADSMKQQGYNLKTEPKGFIVTGQKGPLAEGEAEKATQWGKELSREK